MEMAWQKRKRLDEDRAKEALQADQEAAKETLQIAEKALQAVNKSGGTVSNLYITFLLLGVYIGIIIASTTDRQLLLISPVTLPLLNVQSPILGFYIFVPWLFLLAHFNLLLQLFLMSDKLRVFVRASANLPDGVAKSLHKQLIDFPAVQMLANLKYDVIVQTPLHSSDVAQAPQLEKQSLIEKSAPDKREGSERLQYDRLIQWLLALVVWITVLILPLGLLLWGQLRFLPYHNADITWGHRVAVLLDAIMLLLFWPRLVSGQGAFGGWRKRRTLEQQRYSSVRSGTRVVLLGVIVITLALSWLVATVPEEPWEAWLLAQVPASWQSPSNPSYRPAVFYPTFLLLEGEHKMLSRNLDLREQILTANELSADVQHTLRKGTAQQWEQALQKVQGLNLQGRDLRYAILTRSLLPEADLREAQLRDAALREAQLQGAALREAQLQGADLREAQLRDADLYKAQLRDADLREAQLQGAALSYAQLQGAALKEAQLQGADLREAQLQGADLRGTQLQGAALSYAQLQGADLSYAQLQGAALKEAQLQGAALRAAQLQGADLSYAQLQGAALSYAQLQGADLKEAQLQGAALKEAQLQGAALRAAQLQGADLEKVSIGGVFFKDARLDLADLRRLDLSAVNRESYKTLQSELEKRINDPKIRKNILEKLERVIDQPGRLDGIASAAQCLSDVSKPMPGCFTESEIINYFKARADYLVKVACSAIDAASAIDADSASAIDAAQGILRRPLWADKTEANLLAATLLTAKCETVKTARNKLSDKDQQTLERLARESR